MRALVLKDFGEMAVCDLPDPVPAAGEVIVDVVATGICGSDIHGYTGETGRRVRGQVMGHESVGRIAALGDRVNPAQFAIGSVATFIPLLLSTASREAFAGREQHAPDRTVIGVATDRIAAFAEKIVVPAENIVILPSEMPIAHGALIEPLAVALNAVRRINVKAGDLVIVIGGGPIGQSVVLAALREGAKRVFVSEPDASRRSLCEALGATALDPTTVISVADAITAEAGRLADVAVDAVGNTSSLADALSSTSFGASVCLVGMGAVELAVDAYRVSTEERSIVGSFCYSFDVFREAAGWVGAGDSAFAALISHEVTLEQGPAEFRRLARHADVAGKVLVRLAR